MLLCRIFCHGIFFLLSTVSFASDLTLAGFKTKKTIIFCINGNPYESETLNAILQFPHFRGEKSALKKVHLERKLLTNWDNINDILASHDEENIIENIIVVDYDEGILTLDPENFLQGFRQNFREDCLRFVIGIPKNSSPMHKNNIYRHFSKLLAECFVNFVEHE